MSIKLCVICTAAWRVRILIVEFDLYKARTINSGAAVTRLAIRETSFSFGKILVQRAIKILLKQFYVRFIAAFVG